MWANVQRDGRSAKYRWRPLFNAAKFWLTPTTRVPCSDAAKTRKPLKFAEVRQTRQQISAVSRPKFTILWGHVEEVSMFNKFFPIVDTCLSCEDTARQTCAIVPKWRFFCVVYFQRAVCSTFQTCILIIIIIRTFVTCAVSANILNLRRRQSLGEEDGGSEV